MKYNDFFARNLPFINKSKIGSWQTKLNDLDEMYFKDWVKANKIPWQDIPEADYDMRGYWKSTGGAVPLGHYPDTYKTPYHESFSNESIYAAPNAPRWINNHLTDQITGTIFKEE